MTTIIERFHLGEPQVAGPLAVFPVFGPDPRLQYRAFSEAMGLGALVKELDSGASVRELVVENPTDQPVLIFEGEEVLGAQQNRTFDVSVLVGAGDRARVPVSCVEAGRWDGTRHDERFAPAPHTADPSLRRVKRRRSNLAAAAGGADRARGGGLRTSAPRGPSTAPPPAGPGPRPRHPAAGLWGGGARERDRAPPISALPRR